MFTNLFFRRLIVLALLSAAMISLGSALAGCGSSAGTSSETSTAAAALQEFKSEAGRFSVMVPRLPVEQIQASENAADKSDSHLFSIVETSCYFGVSYHDYSTNAADPQALLDAIRDGQLRAMGKTLVQETRITLDGNPGRELITNWKDEKGDKSEKAHLYIVKNRLYMVTIMWNPRSSDGSEFEDSLQSFKLLAG